VGARVQETGRYTSEHERLCGVLRQRVTAAAAHEAKSGQPVVAGTAVPGGSVDTEDLARRIEQGPAHVLPRSADGTAAVVRRGRRSLLSRLFADRFAFRPARA
jgi:hypothetical protein